MRSKKESPKSKSLNCDYCQKEFWTTQELWFKRIKDKLENGYGTYCCQNCRSAAKISKREQKTLACDNCCKIFPVTPNQWYARRKAKRDRGLMTYCGIDCRFAGQGKLKNPLTKCSCKECGKEVLRSAKDIRRVSNSFCNASCSVTYTNKRQRKGRSRSKIEIYLEDKLSTEFSFLNFKFNDRTAIGLELDIYLPDLKMAFEVNGIFHYLPIFGLKPFEETEERDKRRREMCNYMGISLTEIDISKMGKFTFKSAFPIFEIIAEQITSKLLSA